MAYRPQRRRRLPSGVERRVSKPESWGYGASPLERHIAAEVKAALERIGCDVSSTQQPRKSRNTPGLPDLYASHAAWGVQAWIEVKTPDGRLSGAQRQWHERQRAAGVHVLVVHSAAEALELFGALPRGRGA